MEKNKTQSIKIKIKTMEKLKDMYIETTWVELTNYDDKIAFLIWFYENTKK